jgi:hypothetical protein
LNYEHQLVKAVHKNNPAYRLSQINHKNALWGEGGGEIPEFLNVKRGIEAHRSPPLPLPSNKNLRAISKF